MTDFAKLKQLREETEVSFSLCKKALDEAGDDIEKAKKKLHEWGAKKVADKAGRETTEGGIFSYVHHNGKIATLVDLRSETDFVSGNDEFRSIGKEIAMQLASVPASDVDQLLKQEYIRDPKKTINDLIQDAVLKFGENIKLERIVRWDI